MIVSRRRPLAIATLLLIGAIISSCGRDRSAVDDQLVKVDQVTLKGREESPLYVVEVGKEDVSLTLMADGRDAGDLDISTIITPSGLSLLKIPPKEDLIGRNTTQGPGQSALAFTLPHTPDYELEKGVWRFAVSHWSSPDRREREVAIHTYVKKKAGNVVNVNVWVIGVEDYHGPKDPALTALLGRFRRSLGLMGLLTGRVNLIARMSDEEKALSYIDLESDLNGNSQADGLDRLFALSADVDNQYLNFFLITSFVQFNIIGYSGGLPGPQLIQGTAHSGVAISLLGGFRQLSPEDINLQGDTMAHELGHYLGLFHTSEWNGQRFDPISDTPECRPSLYDNNHDGFLSANECKEADGPNLMFWAAALYPQEETSPMQSQTLRLAPAVK